MKMDVAALQAFLVEAFPQMSDDFEVLRADETLTVVGLRVADRHLRPGGTVSGPAMFGLADVGAYLAILSRIGPAALAVTTNISMDFMRKPAAAGLRVEARMLKLGKQLAVVDCALYSDAVEGMVARSTLTYSLPKTVS